MVNEKRPAQEWKSHFTWMRIAFGKTIDLLEEADRTEESRTTTRESLRQIARFVHLSSAGMNVLGATSARFRELANGYAKEGNTTAATECLIAELDYHHRLIKAGKWPENWLPKVLSGGRQLAAMTDSEQALPVLKDVLSTFEAQTQKNSPDARRQIQKLKELLKDLSESRPAR